MNLLLLGFAILVFIRSDATALVILLCMTAFSAGTGMLGLAGNLTAGSEPFGPPMLQIVAAIGAVGNLAICGFGVAILIWVDLPFSAETGLSTVGVGILNLAYVASHLRTIRAAGFPTNESSREQPMR